MSKRSASRPSRAKLQPVAVVRAQAAAACAPGQADGSAQPEAAATPKQRVRFSGEFPEPLPGTVPYALARGELADLDEADITGLILRSPAWRDVMTPYLDEIDERRNKSARIKPLYDAETLEGVLLYGRVCGLKTYREIRDRLGGDRGREIRALLGLERPRSIPGQKVVKLRSGIPSEATICRHRTKHFPEEKRHEAYVVLEKRWRAEHLQTEGLRREARNLDLDGTAILTHFTGPIYKKRKRGKKYANAPRKLVNGGLSPRGYPQITAPDAGYMPRSSTMDWFGHGWKLISILTQTGVPLAWKLISADASEYTAARELLREQMPEVVDELGERQMRILSADGGFAGPDLRIDCHDLGIHENIHHISHGRSEETKRNVRRANKKEILIQGYKNWYANGHRELKCRCGQGRVVKRSKLQEKRLPDGTTTLVAVPRVEGQCRNCKSITITSGEWYLAQNPSQFRSVIPGAGHKPDYTFGNPLTYHDVVAKEYGHDRFGHNEGFHSMLGSRFGLTDEKRWFRRQRQAEIECAMTFTIMHAVAMEWRRRVPGGVAPPLNGSAAAAATAGAPPGAAAAA